MSVKRSPKRSSLTSEESLPASSGTKFIFKPSILTPNNIDATKSVQTVPLTKKKRSQNCYPSRKSSKTHYKKNTSGHRYLPKRKLSPQQGNPGKVSRPNIPSVNLGQNHFASLAIEDAEPKAINPPKPPPIYLREESSNGLVKKLTELIGKGTFHIVPIKRGKINETKIQVYNENLFRVITKYLGDNNKNYYTYRLKSSKGLVVVIKGIESKVDSAEIKEALELNGFKVKSVFNIFNRDKKTQPMFKVELMPDTAKLKKNETHPIYRLEFLLHRKITVKEPHKRSGPLQCMFCQEYGDLHHLSMCNIKGGDLTSKKCSNCGGNHTANYSPVYKDLKPKLRQKINVLQTPAQDDLAFSSKYQNCKGSTFNVPQHLVQHVSPGIPCANAVRMSNNSGNLAPLSQEQNKKPTVVQNGIEATILNFTQCTTQFMTNMQSMMQNFMASQTKMLQEILSKK